MNKTVKNSWKKMKLSELCTITRGSSPRPIIEWVSDVGTPWVKISDATAEPGRFVSATRECIKNEARSKSVVVLPGDLIVSNSATPGLPKFMNIEACIHDGWLLLRNFKEVLPEFLYYVILNDRKKLVAKGSGSVFTNLKTEILKNHEILLPSVAEQRRIADVLGDIDDLLQKNAELTAGLEEIAQSIFKSWFVNFYPVRAKLAGLKPAGMDEVTAELFPDSMEDSEGGPVPRGWRYLPANEIFDVGIGRTPPRKEPEWFCDGGEGVDWVSIRDMGTFGVFTDRTSEGLTAEALEKFRVPIVPKGTVLMSFKLTVGKLCITNREVVTNEAIAQFRETPDSPIGSLFAYLSLSNLNMANLDSTSSIGTATNSAVVKAIKFLVPTENVHLAFKKLLSPTFDEIANLTAQSAQLVEIRDALLPRLISGELQIPEEMLVS